MKNNRKALLLLMCAVLMVTASVFGTLAYLTDDDTVTNTFTVGSISLELDEAQVTPDGTPVEGAERVKANVYHLLPGGTYTKDPTVHLEATNDDCYVFVKVENGIKAIEAEDYDTIETQISKNGWTKLTGVTDVDNVYYQLSTVPAANEPARDLDLEVFQNFKINGNVTNEALATYANKNVTITAYAIQKAGFADAAAAWNAGNQSVANGGWIPAANNG